GCCTKGLLPVPSHVKYRKSPTVQNESFAISALRNLRLKENSHNLPSTRGNVVLGLPRITIIALVWLVLPTLAQPKPTKEITESEIKGVINTYSDCESPDNLQLDHRDYFDFTGDGQKEAV